MRVAIGVFAEAPIPGRCMPKLLAAHTPEWAYGLYAAMLRDTLDGLQSIDATEYVVFASDGQVADDSPETAEALARHVPAPWRLGNGVASAESALVRLGATDGLAVLAGSNAPAALIDPLIEAIAANAPPYVVLGPTDGGGAWLVATCCVPEELVAGLPWSSPELLATIRVRCTRAGVPLHELPTATAADEPSGVLTLLDELRLHPERAPRTAQYVVTRS
jgi:glycosyltransferase A (GT-A) superfamily protein (DUF2064 family)